MIPELNLYGHLHIIPTWNYRVDEEKEEERNVHGVTVETFIQKKMKF